VSDPGLLQALPDPRAFRRIHVLGVAGTGMGSFAALLKAKGYEVTGSDQNVYPPMSEMLPRWGITAMSPYGAENLDAARPELVVVGNVIRRVNPEAEAMRARAIPHVSFPLALGQLFLRERHAVVVAGTHGKTTTTSLTAHLLASAGRDPSLLVGGVALDFQGNYRLGAGPEFVVEGDEYDTAYFDKGPKFWHYCPKSVLFTSCELDHADIYRDTAHYESAFAKLLSLVPADGHVVACASTEAPARLARLHARTRVESYTATPGVKADWRGELVGQTEAGTRFVVKYGGEFFLEATLPLGGRHNVENAVGGIATCAGRGVEAEELARGIATFRGVKRRQELLGEAGGVLVIDDFAHHPTAVAETIAAIRLRFPERRLVALFEPRSNTSRRALHHDAYARAFGGASHALLARPVRHDQVPEDQQLDAEKLCQDISAAGVPAAFAESPDALLPLALERLRAGDVALVMSNGAFGGLTTKLLAALKERA